MIKLFEQYNEYNQVKQWLDEMRIKNYTINDDLIVDVSGNVSLNFGNFSEIPIQFGIVDGDFNCHISKQITSLKGCPTKIGGSFYFSNNLLTSLEYGPTEVGESYYCSNNPLESLKGCPTKIGNRFECILSGLTSLEYGPTEVDGDFDCSSNNIISLEYSPKIIKGSFILNDNKIKSLEHIPLNIEGNIFIKENPLPVKVLNMEMDKRKALIKYQDEYGIWNDDTSFNWKRFDIFSRDYDGGILSNV